MPLKPPGIFPKGEPGIFPGKRRPGIFTPIKKAPKKNKGETEKEIMSEIANA